MILPCRDPIPPTPSWQCLELDPRAENTKFSDDLQSPKNTLKTTVGCCPY